MLSIFKQKKLVILVTPGTFETIVHLVQAYKLPISEIMLSDFGKSEGMSDGEISSILGKNLKHAYKLDQQPFREWYLEKIVVILIAFYKVIDEDLYKALVNVVNGLPLRFSLLDKTIRKSQSLIVR
jgi:hypothetical protein